MKKAIAAVLVSAVMILGMAVILPVTAKADATFNYTLDGNNATIIKYTGSDTDVIVPDTLDDHPVVAIGYQAFQDSSIAADITSVSMESATHLQSIGGQAFCTCNKLSSVTLPPSLQTIGKQAFINCSSLNTVTFSPSSTLLTIDDYAFYSCTGLTSIQLPASLQTIGTAAFYGSGLTSMALPDSVTKVGDSAFYLCSNLTSVKLSTKLAEIPQLAFQQTGLTSVVIPKGVTEIDFNAFNSCAALETVSLPSTLDTIGDDAFCGCTALTSVDIPGSVTVLGKEAFGDCPILSSVALHEGLHSIGDSAFYGSAISEIIIPASVTALGDEVFMTCPNLTKVSILSDGVTFSGTQLFLATSSINAADANGIYAHANSTAQTFATNNSINFHPGFLVTFNSNGGSAVPRQFVGTDAKADHPGKVAQPANPTKTDYGFAGWYSDAALTVPWNFSVNTVAADTTLYSKWIPATAYLSGISLTPGASLSPSFSKTRTSYTVKLTEGTGSVTITPSAQYFGAVMTINGAANPNITVNLLNGKSATVKVKVAYMGKSHTYTFKVTRAKSTNDNLATLAASAGTISPTPFDASIVKYTINLDYSTSSTTITDTVAAPGLAKASFSSKTVSLIRGQTKVIKLKVKAQSGKSKTYKITVIRAKLSPDAYLNWIKADSVLVTGFDKNTLSPYVVTINYPASSVTLTVQAEGSKATVKMDGITRTSEIVTPVPGGSATVYIDVTAQDGTTVKEYIVTVNQP
jgi:uncharacterized repeat protein (TIGR02543 family)